MTLPLRLRPGAQGELDQLLAEQQDPASPNYHRWLTPDEFGRQFGPSDSEIQRVVDWLAARGFRIDQVARGRGWLNFTGTVRQAEEAFATSIRKFEFRGRLHQSNATEIAVPASIARLMAGPVHLDNFHSRPMHRRMPPPEEPGVRSRGISPLFNGGAGTHYLAPGDFATIYGVTPPAVGSPLPDVATGAAADAAARAL